LRLHLETKSDPELEIWGGQRSADLFTQTFGLAVEVTAQIQERLLAVPAGA
jgi:exopolyphosphatase/guanosine-5'-triphosphate,3'-diphosphate pyrophosphatase